MEFSVDDFEITVAEALDSSRDDLAAVRKRGRQIVEKRIFRRPFDRVGQFYGCRAGVDAGLERNRQRDVSGGFVRVAFQRGRDREREFALELAA